MSSDPKKKECVYEILKGKDLNYVLQEGMYPCNYQRLSDEIKKAINDGYIMDQQAEIDIQSF